jgi:hypothetical protein
MYKKRDKAQLTMDEFYLPFGDGLDANNRWVKIARIIPWDFIEEEYAKNFSEEAGRPSIPSRIAFGASFIKEQENLTDEGTVAYLWEFSSKTGHKTAYNRRRARRNYLKVAKQRFMQETGTHSCPDRIVSLRQPHIRCIVRGKAGRPYEFGQKLHLSVVNGFTFIEDQSYDNYNEGVRLRAAAQRYKERFGHYPEAILADTIYRNRDNRAFCKEHGIRLSGPKLGRPRKDETEESRSQAYQDSCDRNMAEGRNGIGKRRYGLDLIMAYLAETGKTEAAFIIPENC